MFKYESSWYWKEKRVTISTITDKDLKEIGQYIERLEEFKKSKEPPEYLKKGIRDILNPSGQCGCGSCTGDK